MDNITVDVGPPASRSATPAVLIGEQGGERILAEEVRAAARARSTTRSRAGSAPRVPREYHRDGAPA